MAERRIAQRHLLGCGGALHPTKSSKLRETATERLRQLIRHEAATAATATAVASAAAVLLVELDAARDDAAVAVHLADVALEAIVAVAHRIVALEEHVVREDERCEHRRLLLRREARVRVELECVDVCVRDHLTQGALEALRLALHNLGHVAQLDRHIELREAEGGGRRRVAHARWVVAGCGLLPRTRGCGGTRRVAHITSCT
mmetsp:Transcript_37285/g.102910  ORF Transcript_37285/g.102910 Transcript_37285/m.102910 type:complete len:203 (+) Transcript_37285:308-916(+)